MRPVGLAAVKAGREAGGLFFVLGHEEGRALLADGRRRKLAAPKKKSLRIGKALKSVGDVVESMTSAIGL